MKKSNKLFILFCVVSALAFALGFSTGAAAQTAKQIKGRVLTLDNQPAVGAAVMVKGTTKGVVVDLDGNWEMNAPEGSTLTVSMIGYKDSEITVGKSSVYNVYLEEDALRLDDVVVVAYGVQEKATITGAINSIGSDDILRSPTANITGSLAGSMPGLTVVQRSGEPGRDSATLRVRGTGTLTDASAAPLIIIDGVERDNMDLVDANEVESINILKDASATAVYGVRGANGVIIVTTKTGKIGKPQISFSTNFGWQSFTQTPQLADGFQYASLYNEGIDNEGSNLQKFPQFALDAYKNHSNEVIYAQTDWYKGMFKKTAPQQQYNFNVSGGTEKVKYFFSFGMLHQAGMYKEHEYDYSEMDYYNCNSDYLRYTFRSNIDAEVAKGLTLKLRIGAVFTDGVYNVTSTANTMASILNSNPFGRATIGGRFLDGYTGDDPLAGVRKFSNPVVQFYRGGYQMYEKNNFSASGELNYDLGFITQGLNVYGKVAYEDYGTWLEWYTPNDSGVISYKIDVLNKDTLEYQLVKEKDYHHWGTAEKFPDRKWYVYLEGGLNYARSFGLHKVTGLAIYNQRVYHDPTMQYALPKALLGFVGRVTYNYDNRYLAEVDLGYNGSENFAPGKRFGFFPAFSLGWILTEEDFIPKNDIVTYAKIRGSYGEVGNDQIGGDRYLYKPVDYVQSNGYNFGVYGQDLKWYRGYIEGVAGNPNVTWERAKKANVGLDMKMFKSQLSLSTDFFYEKRDNILWDYGTVPTIAGTNLAPANIGVVENKGFEVELGWSSHIGELSYWADGNFSFARNKILFKDEPDAKYPWLMDTGYSVGQYKGLVNEGFINTDAELANRPVYSWGGNSWAKGDLNYVDVNGDGVVDVYDKVPVGYSNYPEVNFGLNLGIGWKGFELSALLQGVTNVSCYMTGSAIAPFYNGGSAQEWHLGRWTEERYLAGEEITFPRVISNMANSPSLNCPDAISSFWLMDASYLRLRNVELAYTIKGNALKKAGISAIRLNVNGSNLLTWAYMKNFDPESPSGSGNFYPMEKVFNFGARFVF